MENCSDSVDQMIDSAKRTYNDRARQIITGVSTAKAVGFKKIEEIRIKLIKLEKDKNGNIQDFVRLKKLSCIAEDYEQG